MTSRSKPTPATPAAFLGLKVLIVLPREGLPFEHPLAGIGEPDKDHLYGHVLLRRRRGLGGRAL